MKRRTARSPSPGLSEGTSLATRMAFSLRIEGLNVMKLKPIQEQVMVITGTSSGIGLGTVYAASQRGACLVLASRSAGTHDQITRDITMRGGRAIAVVADVSVRQQVQGVAQAAVAQFGRIDTWINNAGL